MSTFLERLGQEYDELQQKTDKLQDFIDNNPAFAEVSELQKVLLVTQFNVMKLYLYTLEERILDLTNKTVNQ